LQQYCKSFIFGFDENKIKLGQAGHCHFYHLRHSLRISTLIITNVKFVWFNYRTQSNFRMDDDWNCVFCGHLRIVPWIYQTSSSNTADAHFLHRIFISSCQAIFS